MFKSLRWLTLGAVALAATASRPAAAQPGGAAPNPELIARRNAIEQELESLAIIDRKVMMPMRDGIRLATDIYRPKDTSRKYPTIFVKTPYNFNFWDVRHGVPRDMTPMLEAIKRGYAYVDQNERGHFFSDGNWDILGPPRTDGYDAIQWMYDPVLVQRQGRHHRLLVHRRVADGCRALAAPGSRR